MALIKMKVQNELNNVFGLASGFNRWYIYFKECD